MGVTANHPPEAPHAFTSSLPPFLLSSFPLRRRRVVRESVEGKAGSPWGEGYSDAAREERV